MATETVSSDHSNVSQVRLFFIVFGLGVFLGFLDSLLLKFSWALLLSVLFPSCLLLCLELLIKIFHCYILELLHGLFLIRVMDSW